MAYQSWSVVFGEQPSAAKWNILGTNDASFNDGTGIASEAILSRHLAPTVIVESATGDLSLSSGTAADVPGCSVSVTPAIASYAMVWAFVYGLTSGTADDVFQVVLDVDGVDQNQRATWETVTGGGQWSVSQGWLVSLSAAAHTLKLQGLRLTGSGTGTVEADGTKIMVMIIGDANVTNS